MARHRPSSGGRDFVQFGCRKPITTSVLTNFVVGPSTHDVTYSYVRFEGYTVWGAGACVTMRTAPSTPGTSIYNITFDHCVFAQSPAGVASNAVHIFSYPGSTIYNITFRNCWFEPQSRMGIECNGFGGWWHDITVDHCTFEPSGSQMLSFSMGHDAGSEPPWGVEVEGVWRGVESLHITNNDLRGTGVTVGGVDPVWEMGVELAAVYPYSPDPSVGRSEFSNNRVGRCASSWLNCDYTPTTGVTFANNLFDFSYNPGGITGSVDAPINGSLNDCVFTGNTWVLGTANNYPWALTSSPQSGGFGTNNVFTSEDWIKPGGTMNLANMPWADSEYYDCHFHLPRSVTFPASATGTGCVFDSGHSGGTFK